MTHEQWDEAAFRASIPVAREQVEFAARVCEVGPSQPHWDSHRPVVELIFYLCKLDCDIKVLLLQFLTDPDNRAVWERYLALELHAALHTLPKAINRARMELAKPTTASQLNLQRFDAAATKYRRQVKTISEDKTFMNALSLVRNGVAAHHGLSKGKGMDTSIAWTLSAWRLAQSDTTPFQSQFAEYALTLGRAIQDFGEGITSTSSA